jgi:hypothetical protein
MSYSNANTLSDIKMPTREQIQVPVRQRFAAFLNL